MVNDLIQMVIYILFSALFSASEVSLFSIPREKMGSLATGTPPERRVSALLEQGEKTLVALLLGNIFVNLMVVGLVGKLVTAAVGNSPILFFLGSTGILLLFGEILPKAIALKLGDKVILFTAPLLLFIRVALTPFVHVFSNINRKLLRFNYFFILSSPHPFITDREYRSALERATERGTISNDVSLFLQELGEVSSYPLSRVVVHRSLIEESLCEYRVVKSENGEILQVESRDSGTVFNEIVWFSLSRTIGDLMAFFNETEKRFVLVHDEYGEYYGIASTETLYEYVKNIYSTETETSSSIEVDGDEPVAKYLNWFDDEMLNRYPHIQSVGGILVAWFEMIPTEGAIFESQSYIFEVLLAEKHSVGKLRITRR